MKFTVVKEFNKSTQLIFTENHLAVLKEILPTDEDIFKKLMTIDSPNLVKINDIISQDGKKYIVEEFIDGQTLSDYIKENGKLDDDMIEKTVVSICNGLEPMHKMGIVHRDINPNNIMITKNSDIKIIDYGISRIVKKSKSRDTQVLGTQGYAAPEQFGFAQSSPKADIYAIGVLINVMQTGGLLPYEKSASGFWGDIVERATQIDENNRFVNVSQLRKSVTRKRVVKNTLRKIPGFRTNNPFKKIIASVYYILFAFLMFLSVYDETPKIALLNLSVTILFLLVPVIIFTNFLDWKRKLPVIKNFGKTLKVVFSISVEIINIIVCAFLNNLS